LTEWFALRNPRPTKVGIARPGLAKGLAASDNGAVHDTAAARAYELVNGFRASQLVRLAIQLKIPDLLADGPHSHEELSAATGIEGSRLRRTLRGLAGLGVLREDEDGRFASTEVGELFREAVPGSLSPLAMMLLPESYRAWEHLAETVQTGRTGWQIVFGTSLWGLLDRDSDYGQRFNRAMVAVSQTVADFVTAGSDFSTASVIVDVGGGTGALAAGILRAHPGLRGIVCDLAAGLAGTQEYLSQLGVLDRCTMVESDFFVSVPEGGDVYLLKNIIHDWDDENAALILSACRRAMASSARILLIERLLPARVTDEPAHLNAVMTDLQMMVQLGGRERTEGEYRSLLEGAGFNFSKSVSGGLFGMVEAIAS
jgi:orsellinic acid C2-O-methyltransferase